VFVAFDEIPFDPTGNRDVTLSMITKSQMLSEELRQLWRVLAVFPESFDEAAATAVWEKEDKKARDTLGELLAFSLVEWNEAADRYRLHDLARVFANSRLNESEREAGRQRHAWHYQRLLAQADAIYRKGNVPALNVWLCLSNPMNESYEFAT
jgi:hypothetical protein